MSKTIVKQIHGDTAPFTLWDLYDHELQPYNQWNMQWFKTMQLNDSFDLWDNHDWLQELYDGGKKHKKEFKQFVQENYPTVEWKKVYKEFKEVWELKDKLSGDITPKLEDVVEKDEKSFVAGATLWEPTMELRWVRWGGKHLQQKWRSNTGCEEWRTIKEG